MANLSETQEEFVRKKIWEYLPPEGYSAPATPEEQAEIDRIEEAAKQAGMSFEEFAMEYVVRRRPMKDGSYFDLQSEQRQSR
ncbi:MAG: hypothetical protein FWE67_10185 [Planctomycetaceae bacterium]|nr:hypothetical protein [Planctomycetaceae bacterium]